MNDDLGVPPLLDLADGDLEAVAARIDVPRYDRSALTRSIVHLGVGGFHRAHLAVYVDELCRRGHTGWSIVGSGVTPHDVAMADALNPQHGLYTLIERGASGTRVRVIGSIVHYVLAADERRELVANLADPDVKIASLTITEGGYPVDDSSGDFLPDQPAPAFDVLVDALARRRDEGSDPITVLSCDNVIGNGETARRSVLGTAERRQPSLVSWIESSVAFPNGMVDRITPVTTESDREWLRSRHGVIDRWPVTTEPFCQWVIEDDFVGGMPPFEEVGALVTGNVEPYEILKLRLLNASHSCLAYLSALAGFELVDTAMGAEWMRSFVERFLDHEAIPVLPDVPGIDVSAYARELLERFSNPAIGDQISRLCLDGSSKFPKFLLPTVRAQLEQGGSVRLAALALAGWSLYLRGVDLTGRPIEVSFDPRLADLRELAVRAETDPRAFLGYTQVFGDDLVREAAFVEAFSQAHRSLREGGVRSSLQRATT